MDTGGLLLDHFARIRELYGDLARDLDDEGLHQRPYGTGNPAGWLLWHLARVQDDHVSDLAGLPQQWTEWQQQLGLPNGTDDIGYGHTSAQVDALRIEAPELLIAYHADVHEMTVAYLRGLDADALDRVVDTRWDPPVTCGARLVSVIGDCLQHLGQVGYVKGLASEE